MTFRTYFSKWLFSHGLWEKECDAILDAAMTHRLTPTFAEIANREREGYPDVVTIGLQIAIKAVAAEWLRENKPMHFALPAFDGTLDRESEAPHAA